MTSTKFPLIVSFFTPDWEYETHSKRLAKECEELRLDYRIERQESRGGYIQNSCIKPFYIRECLREAKRPVLWLDVDGSIFKPPAYTLRDDLDFQARKMDPTRRRRIWHVGTMWFNYTPKMLAFIDEWCARTGDMTDESSLDQTFKSRNWNLRTRDLPAEYFFIIRKEDRIPKNVVIGHRLSSGESKKEQTKAFNEYERLIG